MNTASAINLLETTFKNSFSIDNFGYFLTELFNGVQINVRNETKYVKKEFKEYINTFYNLGTYVEEVGSAIGFYVVELAKESTRDRARTMQRNLIADYMKKQHKNAALVAFYEANNPDWRFSHVSLSYELGEDGLKEKLSSPKRHSFLVGPNEPNHTCQKQFLGLLIKEKKIKLSEIAEVNSGVTVRRYIDKGSNNFKEVIVQKSIQKGRKLSDMQKMEMSSKLNERYFTVKGDILMKTPYPNDVVHVSREGLVVGDRIAIIRVSDGFDSSFIAHLLDNVSVRKQLTKLTSSERIPQLSIKDLKEVKLQIPDLETQKRYAKILDLIDERIYTNYEIIDNDTQLKEGILNKLLGGN